MKLPKKIKIPVILLAMAVAALLYSVWSVLSFSYNDEEVYGDAAIVLGAAAWGERPSPVFRERINHAIRLYRNGYVKKIIFTGAKGSSNEPAESVVAMRYAVKLKVPRGDILIEKRSRTTEENLYYANEIARQNGLESFLLVSDPLHMKRAMLIAKDLGMNAIHSPTTTTMYKGWGKKIKFLAREVYFNIRYHTTDKFR